MNSLNLRMDPFGGKKTAKAAYMGVTAPFRVVSSTQRGGLPLRSSRLLPFLLGLALLMPHLTLAQTETKLIASDAGDTVIATWEVSRSKHNINDKPVTTDGSMWFI